ncbi:hypothetical protein KCU85_g7883, partial [Aureobasidium melanogenum]
MTTHRCTLCLQSNIIKDCNTDRNMRSHLGAPSTHNMGPLECRIPGCGHRSQRQDRNIDHGNHQAVWGQPQALVTALNREVQACRQAFLDAVAQVAPPVAGVPPAAQGHSIAAQGPSAPAPMVHNPVPVAHTAPQDPAAAQVPPAAAQVHPAAAQDPAVIAFDPAQFPPPTDYFEQAMDEFERRYAGVTREDIEKQYEEEQELYYQ